MATVPGRAGTTSPVGKPGFAYPSYTPLGSKFCPAGGVGYNARKFWAIHFRLRRLRFAFKACHDLTGIEGAVAIDPRIFASMSAFAAGRSCRSSWFRRGCGRPILPCELSIRVVHRHAVSPVLGAVLGQVDEK
jgi:hypothetical protein